MWFNLGDVLSSITSWESASFIWEYWKSGGHLMIPIALICFLILHRYFMLRRRLKSSLSSPVSFNTELKRRLEQGLNGSGLDQWLSSLPGLRARVLGRLLPWLRRGMPFREGYRQCRLGELSAYSGSFGLIAALVVAAPLLGLLGTVLGMIHTFDAITMRSSESTEMIARGISQALITTQAGLVAALPGTFGVAHLSRLHKRLKIDLGVFENQLSSLLGGMETDGYASK